VRWRSRLEEGSSFLKKEAKNFCEFWLQAFRIGSAQGRRSYLVLFFKKEQAFFALL
jgi:hypothetical protein